MITVKDFLLNKVRAINYKQPTPEQFEEFLIEFARIHVKEALKQVSEKGKLKYSHTETFNGGYGFPSQNSDKYKIDQDSILSAYSLDGIV